MKTLFANLNGNEIYKYTLKSGNLEVDVINYGATIIGMRYRDKNGKILSIVSNYNTIEEYISGKDYRGATIGRFSNRIENGKFTINGVNYQITQNENQTALHGGVNGFDKKIWEVKEYNKDKIVLFYRSIDGEEGFPGNLDVTLTYSIIDGNSLKIDYLASTDKDTTINLTNHSYFNVDGTDKTTDNLLLMIDADKITPVDSKLIPHNEFKEVKNTLFDFRKAKPFICDLSSDETLKNRGCYDENFVLNGSGLRVVAKLISKTSGLTLEVITDQPGMQIYTGNKIAIALETQNYPNAINCDKYPSSILKVGEKYQTTTIYKLVKNS